MEDIIELARNVDVLRYIVVVKLKIGVLKQVRYIVHIACYQVVHANNIVPFFYKPIA